MGGNLSSTFVPDTSKVVLSPTDRTADFILVALWGGAIYAMAMIFSTCALVDRWRGPLDKHRTGPGSIMAALVMSTAWPVVLTYLMVSG